MGLTFGDRMFLFELIDAATSGERGYMLDQVMRRLEGGLYDDEPVDDAPVKVRPEGDFVDEPY